MDPIMALLIVSCQIFQLQASLEAPQLTVRPRRPYYMTGDIIILTCSLPGYCTAEKLIFLEEKTEFSSSGWRWNCSEDYPGELPQLYISSFGDFKCKHCATSKKQPTHCLGSNSVRITVLEQPHLPFLSMSPKHEIHIRWEFINLTCSVSDGRNISKILFLKDETELAFLEPSSSPFTHSLQLLPQEDGNYSCKYWVVDSEWEIPSQESNTISISVTVWAQHPYLALEHARWAIPLLTAMVLLIFCCRERASKYRKKTKLAKSLEGTRLGNRGTLELRTTTF